MSIAAPILVNNFFLNFRPWSFRAFIDCKDHPLPLDLFDHFR